MSKNKQGRGGVHRNHDQKGGSTKNKETLGVGKVPKQETNMMGGGYKDTLTVGKVPKQTRRGGGWTKTKSGKYCKYYLYLLPCNIWRS